MQTYGRNQDSLEHKLREKYGNFGGETESTIQNRSIAEQMTYYILLDDKKISKRETKVKHPTTKKEYRSVLDMMSEETFLKKKQAMIEEMKKNSYNPPKSTRMKDIKYKAETALMYTGMGALKLFMVLCELVQKASISYLNKTRPDVASMMRKGAPFPDIAKQYFQKK